MTDHNTHPLNARDLTTRLTSLQTASPPKANGRPRATASLSSLPTFSKSSTMSSTSTSATQRSHAEIGAGEFSKPSRRSTQSSTSTRSSGNSAAGRAKEKEFQYYGRHANQWLFNDFSVTDAVARGVRRVLGKDNNGGDWYENRGR